MRPFFIECSKLSGISERNFSSANTQEIIVIPFLSSGGYWQKCWPPTLTHEVKKSVMPNNTRKIIELDPNGFNELCMCRSGPMLYNKFDIYIGRSLQKYGEYSFGELEIFRQIVHSGFIAVEIGANIGAHTVELSKLVGPDGAVFAFEPQRLVFQTLCANLALNHCANVYAQQAAVGAEDGSILVPAVNPAVQNNFGGISLCNLANGEPVPLFTLDSIALPACQFLKVDVEGMEVDVLKGATQTISKHRPMMYLENDRKDRSQELIGLVLSLGYDIYWHTPLLYNPENFAGDKENIFSGLVSGNIFCIPKELNFTVNGMQQVTSVDDTWLWGG